MLLTPKSASGDFGQFDHVRRYGCDVGDRLREAGFDVTEVRASAIVTETEMTRYGLWDDFILRCERPLIDKPVTANNKSNRPMTTKSNCAIG